MLGPAAAVPDSFAKGDTTGKTWALACVASELAGGRNLSLILLQHRDSQGAGEPTESIKHLRIGFRIELSENTNNQIGAVCLLPRLLNLLRDEVSFHG
jgi:hypothetical protein